MRKNLAIIILILVLACVYYSAHYTVAAHGIFYQAMSVAPLDFTQHGGLSYRILTPFLAHILFLRGSLYFIFPLLMGLGFLISVFYYFKQSGFKDTDSLLATAMFAFSGTLFVTLYCPGLVDTTSYLLIMLCMLYIDRKVWFLFFALALLNHPSNMFLLPALIFLHLKNNKMGHWEILTIIPCIIWYSYVNRHIVIPYDFGFYLSGIREVIHKHSGFGLLGIFMSFKLLWIFPVVVLVVSRNLFDRLFVFTILFFVSLQLLFLEDSTRVMVLALPAVVWGIKITYQSCSLKHLFLFNLLIPTVYISGNIAFSIYPFWIRELTAIFK